MLSGSTIDTAFELVRRELVCYESNLERGCYDKDSQRYSEVAEKIKALNSALAELGSL